MKEKIISFLIIVCLAAPIVLCTYKAHQHGQTVQKMDITPYVKETTIDVETEVLGEEPQTDFKPGYYEFDPYPGAIKKHIEATAYCYGTTTCTGKAVREGYAAMSKRYLGMTAVVYEADENGEPLDYIGTYEIEDTGGDERIRNGNCIDIYIPDYNAAIEFGRKQVVVYLIEAKG